MFNVPLVADEKVLVESPDPQGIFMFCPSICEGNNGRLIVGVDWSGPHSARLDGPRSDCHWDSPTGSQIRLYVSDDDGKSWRDVGARLPMLHGTLFKVGTALYVLGHSGRLMITRSTDNGETWCEPRVIRPEGDCNWHGGNMGLDISHGKITMGYEHRIGPKLPFPGVAPVLLQANVEDDLLEASSWRTSPMYDIRSALAAAAPSGLPGRPLDFTPGCSSAGVLETNVMRIWNQEDWRYDESGRSFVILMRATAAMPNVGVMLKGVEHEDGSLSIERWKTRQGQELLFLPLPGGHLKFYVTYDEVSKLYWMVHSVSPQNVTAERQVMGLSYSKTLMSWGFAGVVAYGEAANCARGYASMTIHGSDLLIVSRSGDLRAASAHNNNLVTFHRVRDFRNLVTF